MPIPLLGRDRMKITPWKSTSASLTPAIISDIDGTLAHMTGRHPYDWSRCHEDDVDEVVRQVVQDRAAANDIVILITGREEAARENTEWWLDKHKIRYDFLFMRPTGDRRPGALVKKEIYLPKLHDRFHVRFWLEDENEIVHMVRQELKLKCFQVAEQDRNLRKLQGTGDPRHPWSS